MYFISKQKVIVVSENQNLRIQTTIILYLMKLFAGIFPIRSKLFLNFSSVTSMFMLVGIRYESIIAEEG